MTGIVLADHVVVLHRDTRPSGVAGTEYRYRVVCRCSWSSPWRTTAPTWPDSRQRSWRTPRAQVIRAAGEHLRGR